MVNTVRLVIQATMVRVVTGNSGKSGSDGNTGNNGKGGNTGNSGKMSGSDMVIQVTVVRGVAMVLQVIMGRVVTQITLVK